MYHQLASRLALGTDATEVSQPVNMAEANAAQMEATVFYIAGSGLEFQLQSSNDLENWQPVDSAVGVGLGFTLLAALQDIAAAYVRIAYTTDGSTTAVFAAGLNTSSQS